MKQIPLTNSRLFALVDDDDYGHLSQWNWQLVSTGHAGRSAGKVSIMMHRDISDTPPDMDTDHRDTNKLNNQRYNLRHATRSQNMANTPKRKGGTSVYKGVWFFKRTGKWASAIKKDYRPIHLGYFHTEAEAARAYNAAALELFGEFGRLNIIPE